LLYVIDAQTPVLLTQKKLEKLKLMEIREKRMLYIFIPLLSPIFLIVGAKAFFNLDLYLFINWIIAQTAASILIAAIIVYVLKKFPDKNLDRTLKFLNEIAETEKE
jgi:C4-dicarboxylate transporter